jgi:tetratricopeptide (TPR) repeat protein
MRRLFPILLLAASALGPWACGAARREHPDVLLVTVSGLRADYLSAYGYQLMQTPFFDSLAAGGVLFERCLTPAPETLPGAATLMTGLPPSSHGAFSAPYAPLRKGVPVLAEVLRDAGYGTAAFVSSGEIAPEMGLARGFDHYDAVFSKGEPRPVFSRLPPRRRAEETVAAFSRWMDSAPAAPCFVWVELADTLYPYELPDSMKESYGHNAYEGLVSGSGAQCAKMLEIFRKKRGNGFVFLLTAEHGQDLQSHGENGSGLQAFDSVLRVPLLMLYPGSPAGVRVAAQVRSLDVAPTLAALAHAELPGTAGREILSLVSEGGEDAGGLPLRVENYGRTLRFGWKPVLGLASADGAWKYLDSPAPALYYREGKAPETENLLYSSGDVAMRLKEQYGAGSAAASPVFPEPEGPVAGALRAMGLEERWKTALLPENLASVADPNTFVRDFEGVQRLVQSDAPGALARAEAFFEAHPRNPAVMEWLASVYFVRRRYEEAEPLYGFLLSERPANAEGWNYLGLIRMAMGDYARAEICLKAARHLDPRFPGYAYNLGEAAMHQRRYEEAAGLYREALDLGGRQSGYHYKLAAALEAMGRKGEALAAYRRAWALWQGSEDQRDFIGAAVRRLEKEAAADAG